MALAQKAMGKVITAAKLHSLHLGQSSRGTHLPALRQGGFGLEISEVKIGLPG
jgi:hypothetical protein